MNKKDILQSYRQQSQREYIQFLDFKTVPLIILTFLCLCSVMIILSFFSPYQKDILYTTGTLIFSFSTFYSLSCFYYLHRYLYLIMGCFFAVLLIITFVSIWLIIW